MPTTETTTPNISFTLRDQRGGQKIQQVKVDSNEAINATESASLMRELLAIPGRIPDIVLMGVTGMSGFLCLTAILRMVRDGRVMFVCGLAMAFVVAVGVLLWRRDEDVRPGLLLWGVIALFGAIGGSL